MTVPSTCFLGPPHPTRKLYSLPKPDKEAQGLIWPSSFPVGRGVFLYWQERQIIRYLFFKDSLPSRVPQGSCPYSADVLLALHVHWHQEINLSLLRLCPQQTPASLLYYLPTPHWPWSQRGAGYVVTGLPPSEGITTILIWVHHFSKVVPFFPLLKIPLCQKTAYLFYKFRLHKISFLLPLGLPTCCGSSVPTTPGQHCHRYVSCLPASIVPQSAGWWYPLSVPFSVMPAGSSRRQW